jgi:hypothetical protein
MARCTSLRHARYPVVTASTCPRHRCADAGGVTDNTNAPPVRSTPSTRAVGIIVHVGTGIAPELPGAVTVTVSPESAEPRVVLAALRASGLDPALLRSHPLVNIAVDVPADIAVAVYAALVIIAGRRMDVAHGNKVLNLVSLDRALRRVPASERPNDPLACVQVGGPHTELPSVRLDGGKVTPSDIAAIRHARRVRLVAGTTPEALSGFIAVAALRARPGMERFPMLVTGAEPADPDPLPDGVLPAGVDLDLLRAGATDLRQVLRVPRQVSVMATGPVTDRSRRFGVLAGLDMTAVLAALGSTSPDGSLWHCPRPDRHSNGDANASMGVDATRSRCYRCDDEWVNPLRLVADVRGITFDAAADWLEGLDLPPAGAPAVQATTPTIDEPATPVDHGIEHVADDSDALPEAA